MEMGQSGHQGSKEILFLQDQGSRKERKETSQEKETQAMSEAQIDSLIREIQGMREDIRKLLWTMIVGLFGIVGVNVALP